MTKTNKSLKKRIKITGGNKIMKRPPHQNHFNAKEDSNTRRHKKGEKLVPREVERAVKTLLTTVQF